MTEHKSCENTWNTGQQSLKWAIGWHKAAHREKETKKSHILKGQSFFAGWLILSLISSELHEVQNEQV